LRKKPSGNGTQNEKVEKGAKGKLEKASMPQHNLFEPQRLISNTCLHSSQEDV
jgi:hypothetical protein